MAQPAETTAAACSRERCDGCEIRGDLICVATPLDLADFGIMFVNADFSYDLAKDYNSINVGTGISIR